MWSSWCRHLPRDVGAIVVAAGRGVRFGSEIPKQYVPIGGVPIVLRALRPFTSHPEVAHVVLVLPPRDIAHPPEFIRNLSAPSASSVPSPGSAQLLTLVPGGSHRGNSVRAGLATLRPECRVVLVHDGARPFVDRRIIDAVIGHARRGDGAVPALPLSDTLKEASAEDPTRVTRTRPRARLWRAQTPQGFPRDMLEKAHARAARLGHRATDDAALAEAMGFTVRLVPDYSNNIKITTPEDLALAELLTGGSR
jgi:2-C-methyl-D-erythritol 4-phosphate cytidylyltransferase